jgi:hypothetical protein
MEIAIIVILLVLMVALFLKFRSGSTGPAKTAKKGKTKTAASSSEHTTAAAKPFTAVTLAPGPGACEAVLSFEGARFLSGDAPLLPLADCGSSSCTCKYMHYEDRRDINEERRQPFSMRTELHSSSGEEERRLRAGRRGPDEV